MKRLLLSIISIVLAFFQPIVSHGAELLYPVGIADVEQLTGKPFNLDALKSVPLFLYMGALDDNDMDTHTGDRYQPEKGNLTTRNYFGSVPIERWPRARQIYDAVGCDSMFVLYPGVGHEITEQMRLDVVQFFRESGNPGNAYAQDYQIIRITPEQSSRNFYWPYYLLIPDNPRPSQAVLLVEPNNTGYPDDDPTVHDQVALSMMYGLNFHARALGSPVLMPAFPRPYLHDLPIRDLYTHALNWNTMTSTIEGLERIDLQLIAMIDDARERLSTMGIATEDKVFMMGYSASGAFANRFTMLHPELIKAAAIGAPGGFPILPVARWPETQSLPGVLMLLLDE
ncbi:hypothetical protein [Desulfonatronum sp. SC1]|uniref:hypothetical protein n=1 Tax=Desulfonatronum sp. SC1 TaxID=2109626 RepID=UPI000D322541|nr:hypothetical protein [Desulfonatronum sp. SC1]PTN32858.1 hypothetical protein C6366_15520 [Desulfonatronum sp. SC1]